jgi:lysophospholipase
MNPSKKLLLSLSFLLTATSNYALDESKVFDTISTYMTSGHKCQSATDKDFWKRKVVETPYSQKNTSKKYRLRYSEYGCELGEKGALVIAPGRSESSPEYYETAIDYIAKGYSPVFVIDHRGQGLSPRMLKNQYKGHVVEFIDYVTDFKFAVDQIQKDLKANYGRTDQPLFLTTNSMGTGISLGYLQMVGEKSPFTASAFLGSMIRVNYLSFVKKEPTFLNNRIYSEEGVIAQAGYACLRGNCDEYTRPELFGDYRPGTRNYVELGSEVEMEAYMTHSKNRYDLRTFIWDEFDWSTIVKNEYKGENWSGPQIGGATFSWALTTTKFLKNMRKTKSIKKMANKPLLILTGEKDLRAYTPSKDGSTSLATHKAFCEKVNSKNKSGNKSMCKFSMLNSAYHEIYKESDIYRTPSVDRVATFFESL